MTYGPNSPIRGPAVMTAQQLYVAFEDMTPPSQRADARILLDTIVVLCQRLGVDPVVMAAIVWIETGESDTGLPFRSAGWLQGYNAGNLGITGDPQQNAAAQKWPNPEAAAYGLVAHMVAYVYGESWRDVWPEEWGDPRQHDRRFSLVLDLPTYRAKTLLDLNGKWAVDRDNNYHGKLAERANRLIERAGVVTPPTTPPQEPTMPLVQPLEPKPLPKKNVPPPDNMIWLPVQKYQHFGSQYGYIYTASNRHNVGVVHHQTQGRGSVEFYRNFFSCPSGERCGNAMVDFVIERSGRIAMINNPFWRWAGWANGGGANAPGGLEGDGPLFVAKLGLNAIDLRMVSVEYENLRGEPLTRAQIESGGALAAWIHDLDGQSWREHPFTSKYGCVTSMLHFEFGTTNCALLPADITAIQAVTRGLMKQHQEGGTGQPDEPDFPGVPLELPGGLTLDEYKKRFGRVKKIDVASGRVTEGGFDPKGIISVAWAHRANEEDDWSPIETWYVLEDSGKKLDLITFANDWRMAQVAERAGMQWVDLVPAYRAAA